MFFLLLNKMDAMPIYGKKKTLKSLFIQNKECFEADSWYTALQVQGLLILFKCRP